MTAAGRYVTGLALAGVAGAALTSAAGPAIRSEIATGIFLGLLLQAPLGWWTIRSLGSQRFQLVWTAGMLIRLVAVALTGLVLIPLLRWQMGPALGALAATLAVLLLVESVTAFREYSGNQAP